MATKCNICHIKSNEAMVYHVTQKGTKHKFYVGLIRIISHVCVAMRPCIVKVQAICYQLGNTVVSCTYMLFVAGELSLNY